MKKIQQYTILPKQKWHKQKGEKIQQPCGITSPGEAWIRMTHRTVVGVVSYVHGNLRGNPTNASPHQEHEALFKWLFKFKSLFNHISTIIRLATMNPFIMPYFLGCSVAFGGVPLDSYEDVLFNLHSPVLFRFASRLGNFPHHFFGEMLTKGSRSLIYPYNPLILIWYIYPDLFDFWC